MRLRFTKMHGLGNDFVVIDAISQAFAPTAELIRRIADRRFGVGCDQVLLVEPPRQPGAELRYRIFNADGGEVAQCGNGARCFLRFVQDKGLTAGDRVTVESAGGMLTLESDGRGMVTVDMGAPRFAPAALPFRGGEEALRYTLDTPAGSLELGAVSMGNPHAVIRVPAVDEAPVAEVGAMLGAHPAFPEGVNVGFMEVITSRRVRLRVHERGVGETLACGTGACAAVVVGCRWGILEEPVVVALPGGELTISWAGDGGHVLMTGPATTVFEGEMTL